LAIPQWKSFITNDSNKAALQSYLAVSLEKHTKELPRGFKLIVAGLASDPGKTFLLTAAGSSEIPDLSCTDHEEADTRIFAHISYFVNQYGCQRAVIQATDTDIFIMAIYYSVRIPGLRELWMQKGCSYIACHIIANLLDEMFTLPVTLASSALLCVHIISSCDTVSYVFGKGKKKSFKVAMANAADLTEMTKFGDDTHDVTEAVTDVCGNFFEAVW